MPWRKIELGTTKKPRKTKRSSKQPERQRSGTLLDEFSPEDIRRWTEQGEQWTEFAILCYNELQSQRDLFRSRLEESVRPYFAQFQFEKWVRCVSLQYSCDPLSAAGSLKKIGGRFNFGHALRYKSSPFPTLYIGEDAETALREMYGIPTSKSRGKLTSEDFALINHPNRKSDSSIRMRGSINWVFDLTLPVNVKEFLKVIKDFKLSEGLKKLGRKLRMRCGTVTTERALIQTLMTENWRRNPILFDLPANSQIFGQLLLSAGCEGVLYRSTMSKRRCLGVFVQNFASSDSYVELEDVAAKGTMVTRLSSETWQSCF